MSALTESGAWRALALHRDRMAGTRIAELFAADPGRHGRFSLEFGELYLDYSKHLATAETMLRLQDLARQAKLGEWIRRLFAGERINSTEDRPALHVALRSTEPAFPPERNVMPEVRAAKERMRSIVEAARAGGLAGATGESMRSVVNLGVGGCILGPSMATRALRTFRDGPLSVAFAGNADPADLDAVLADLDPARTLFIVSSKSFTTPETLDNARRARQWIESALGTRSDIRRHFVAVTAVPEAALEFGIAAERVLPIWDWVGGRYSLWSAIGLPIALACGMDRFDRLLEGARDMDAHFHTAPLESNLPVTLALLGIWYANFFGAQTHALIPYCEDLREMPAWLQQLEMESNGKRVDREGGEVDYHTAPVIWGGIGTSSQHSFHQLLHQGTRLVPVDFVLAADAPGDRGAQDALLANALAQSSSLMAGARGDGSPHRCHPGNRPSTTIVIDRLSPESLGQLLAMYEHKVFVQGVIWNINSFDQWGVELGKTISSGIGNALRDGIPSGRTDPSTEGLIRHIRYRRQRPGGR